MGDETKRQVRVLHCGDLHLDSPFPGLSAEQSAERRAALRQSFSEMIAYVREERVDLVLMSGDLFDAEYVTNETVDGLIRAFGSCPLAHFVIAPGAHDPCIPKGIYASGRFPPNVHVFEDEVLTRIDFDHLNTAVYGWAFAGGEHRFSPLSRKRAEPGRLNLLCGYTEIETPGTAFCPVTDREVQLFGADYAGFSHFHVTHGFRTVGRTICAYSGCLEPRGYEETRPGGANLVTATEEDDGWKLSARRLQFGQYRYLTCDVDLSGLRDADGVEERAASAIRAAGADEKTLVRLVYRGEVAPAARLARAWDPRRFGVYAVEVEDLTLPLFGMGYLLRDMSAKGELYRRLLPAMRGEDPAARTVAATAFRVGLAALEGRDVTGY